MPKKNKIHKSAIVEDGVDLGSGTSVWDNVHIRENTKVGDGCIIGEKTYIAYDVKIGNRCKINAFVYICNGVTLEDGVMVSAHTTFTNDLYPRATTPDLDELLPSDPDESTLHTLVREGATIGAGCTIAPGVEIGRFAMVGMGAVVTGMVGDFQLVVGNPARIIGTVCRCGHRTSRYAPNIIPHQIKCQVCKRQYQLNGAEVTELIPEPA